MQPTVREHPGGAGWPGWLRFAGAALVMTGGCDAVGELAGMFDGDFYVVVGGLAALAGLPLLAGAAWAGPVASALATINAVGQLVFVAVYPLWTMLVLALCAGVVWAVAGPGDEARTSS